MKKILLLSTVAFCFFSANAQDTTRYLFHNLNYSYMQYTFGYESVAFNRGDQLNAFYASIIGAAFGNKLAIGLDLDAAMKDIKNFTNNSTYPQTSSFLGMYLNMEPLIRPKGLVNFSVPVKFGFANASRWDTTFDSNANFIAGYSSTNLNHQVNEYSDNFLVGSVGVNCFINLWKSVSAGGGASYRYSMNTAHYNHAADYSGFSVFALVRFRWDTRAYYAKMLQRQKEYYQQMGNPASH
ncbi:MAG: hypothetical protein HY064_07435 [Bacteroidetes bacterium]|nr:hypothetical protein [Bacteroidota bacterium]